MKDHSYYSSIAFESYTAIVNRFNGEFHSKKLERDFDIKVYFPNAFKSVQKELYEVYKNLIDQAEASGDYTNELSEMLYEQIKRHCDSYIIATVAK